MGRVAIVDYGMGNLDSVARAVEGCGGEPIVTSSPEQIAEASALILPGVGAFAKGMANIRERGLEEPLHEQVREHGVPVLGLCLGMQLLASRGDESGEAKGLGWIDGTVARFEPKNGERIPHVGWNQVEPTRPSTLLAGVAPGSDFYFVHSYYLSPHDEADVVATTPYCGGFASIVARDKIYGVQFHPEKSQRVGFALIRNFLAVAGAT